MATTVSALSTILTTVSTSTPKNLSLGGGYPRKYQSPRTGVFSTTSDRIDMYNETTISGWKLKNVAWFIIERYEEEEQTHKKQVNSTTFNKLKKQF